MPKKRRSPTDSDEDSRSDQSSELDSDSSRRERKRSRRSESKHKKKSKSKSKSKKHRNRSSSSHSDDSSSENDRRRSDGSRKKEKKDKKAKSDKKKRRETSEERRQRKVEQKMLKEELAIQKESQIAAQMSASLGYTNKENPFGDSNLNQKFVWVKKRERDAEMGVTSDMRMRKEMERRQEIETELEKLKKRRTEREIELQLREQEQLRLQREMDQAAMGDWKSKENEFHLEQAKRRAQIRITQGRAKPIDILAMNISIATDTNLAEEFDAMGIEMSVDEPYLIFQNLELKEVEELHQDIQLYLTLETDESNRAFWEAMIVVCDDELSKHRMALAAGGSGKSGSSRTGSSSAGAPRIQTGVSESVAEEIDQMLSKKTLDQLIIVQRQVESKLREGGPVDVEYWEALLKALIVWKAKARLRDMHSSMLRKRLEQLKKKQQDEEMPDGAGVDGQRPESKPLRLGMAPAESAPEAMEEDLGEEGEEAEAEEAYAYDPSLSPILMRSVGGDDQNLDIVEEEDDYRELLEMRKEVMKQRLMALATKRLGASEDGEGSSAAIDATSITAEEAVFMKDASKNMGVDETAFADEAVLAKTTYLWQDKYRPRKPRYFNRVHTGYEWNKYNQTHYDSDNPPPKVVQGYKFNVFYPDLIDKSKAPTYKIVRDEGFPDTVVIKFIAGPPYEDIAFRIVNREWEYSHKKGFRSSFDRGVLQLHFHFKRHYYRR
ncbi:hypothetical protein HK102_007611 [Quaeritorhiza haematococci]|nr:hypothetical protein HK102_007611 [Quaeritorhiza haematococci]